MSDAMTPLEAGTEIVKSTKNDLAALLTEVYGDALKPAFQEVGEVLGNVLSVARLASLPFKLAGYSADALDRQMNTFFKNTFQKVPAEKLKRPDLNIAAGVVENMKYVMDKEELREMYENLLASAMNEDSADECHPSFATMIRDMTPFEAKFLKTLRHLVWLETEYGPNCAVYNDEFIRIDEGEISIAISNLKRLSVVESSLSGYTYTMEHFLGCAMKTEFDYAFHSTFSEYKGKKDMILNFLRKETLGTTKCTRRQIDTRTKANMPGGHSSCEICSHYGSSTSFFEVHKDEQLYIHIFQLTPLGNKFYRSCIGDTGM